MSSYKELLEQKAALEKQIAQARTAEVAAAIAKVKELVAAFELTAEDVFSSNSKRRESSALKGGKVAAKYRNPETGDTWTGRGKAPRWLDGKDRSQFLIG